MYSLVTLVPQPETHIPISDASGSPNKPTPRNIAARRRSHASVLRAGIFSADCTYLQERERKVGDDESCKLYVCKTSRLQCGECKSCRDGGREKKGAGAMYQSLRGASSSLMTESMPSAQEKKKPRPKDVFGRPLPTEEQFEVLKNAPRLETGAPARVKPFGVEIRNVKCLRCGNFGHQSGDRECPLKDAIMPNEENRLKRDDPLTAILAQTNPSEDFVGTISRLSGMIRRQDLHFIYYCWPRKVIYFGHFLSIRLILLTCPTASEVGAETETWYEPSLWWVQS